MTALFDFAADIVRAHAEALTSSKQDPYADNMGGPFGAPASAQDLTPSPSCSVIRLDDRRHDAP